MTKKTLLFLLPILFTLLKGEGLMEPQVLHVRAGQMVLLQCPYFRSHNDSDTRLLWTSPTTKEMNVTNGTSTSADQRQVDVLIHGRSLVILRASVNHQGNYSCSRGNASKWAWFRLTVYTTQSREHEESSQNPSTCYMQQSCTLNCPAVKIPPVNITSSGIAWHKEGKPLPENGYIQSVDEKDSGVYTCTRSYLYRGQTYNMTFTVSLDVQPSSEILSPHKNEVFQVNLNSTVVINCTAFVNSEFDEVFWLSGSSFVESNDSFPVFYNYTRGKDAEQKKMTASLVFKKISEEDLLKRYSCKLESAYQSSSFVTITLAQKARPFPLSLTLCVVAIMGVIVGTIVVAMILSRGWSCRKGSVRLHREDPDRTITSHLSTSWSRV